MKNKQSLRLHQAQRQRQAFSPARGRFIEILTKTDRSWPPSCAR